MNRKLTSALAVALVAIFGVSAAWNMTWTESRVTMTAGTSSVVSLGLFTDCAATIPFTSYNWNGVVEGQEYEVTAYVRNTGNQAVYVTYNPGSLSFDDAQTRFNIVVSVLEGPGMPCQLLPVTESPDDDINPFVNLVGGIPLPLKDPLVCSNGFLLLPGKVIKIDIVLFVESVVAGGSWSWDFFIVGCAP